MAYKPKICPECSATFVPSHGRQQFCTTIHKADFHRIMANRGKVLLPLLQQWRAGKHGMRPNQSYAFKEACRLADAWNAEDRKSGRRTDLIVSEKRRLGWNADDLLESQKRRKALGLQAVDRA